MTTRNLLFFLLIFSNLFSLSGETQSWISLKGFLGKEEISQAEAALKAINDNYSKNTLKEQHTIILEIDSSSGDLMQLLDFARLIYESKKLHHFKYIVYIDDHAVGPAAILPFLADEIYTSFLASWGDVSMGSEGTLPANLLSNRIQSFVDPNQSKTPLLQSLAHAMSDPSYKNNATNRDERLSPMMSIGQTLVLNQLQIGQLGLSSGILPLSDFKEKTGGVPLNNSSIPSSNSSENKPSSPNKIFQSHIHFHKEGENIIGHILIEDRDAGINESTWLYVKKALDLYKEIKPIFIILELNTPGGEVFAAQKISDALKEIDTQNNIPVIAFINNWAISAGAMLAYSCRYIAVVKDATMGAAEPIIASQSGQMQSASEKINSAIRTDFASRASFFGRNPLLAEAMVDKDLILVWRHERIVKLDNENQIRTTGPEPDVVVSPKGKLLTLTASEMMKYGVANLELSPHALPPVTPEEKLLGRWPANKMLLFQDPFFSGIPNAHIESYRMDWKTHFFVFLATPMISSLLLMGLMIGAYMELNHPGALLPGFVAAVSLVLILISSFSLEIAHWLELIFLLIGFVLIIVELFFVPTFGLIGVLGIFLFLFGLFGMLLPGIGSVSFDLDSKTMNAAGQFILNRLAWLSGAFILSLGIIITLARYVLPAFSGLNPFILQGNEQEASKGYIAGEKPQDLPMIGESGIIFATLRPTGKIVIKERIYDAISEGDFIEKGESIVVTGFAASLVRVVEKNRYLERRR
jgi:membrane-bound serine protease (ClpP class)